MLRGQNAEIQKGRIYFTNLIFLVTTRKPVGKKIEKGFSSNSIFPLWFDFVFALFVFCKIFSEAIYLCKNYLYYLCCLCKGTVQVEIPVSY